MERLEAMQRLIDLVEGAEDEQARDALALLVGGGPPFPPCAYGAVGGSALELAKHVHKTGSEWDWQTPAPDSVGMERLVHRMTNLLESFLNLWEEARERERVGEMTLADVVAEEARKRRQANSEWLEYVRKGPDPTVFDEAYQAAFCDECGFELTPDGRCVVCLARAGAFNARANGKPRGG